MPAGNRRSKTTQGTLGTFAGVFTPSILTILGIILFRRLGYVVGQGGLFNALIIISIANVISILTSISVAAIATNVQVKGGGDYYLISRTLGLEFGGAIGIVLFLAQSVSVAFYCLGFGEAIALMIPGSSASTPSIVALISTVLLFLLARAGADYATKFQYIVMVVLILALISFFGGGFSAWDGSRITDNWNAPANAELGFWMLFAIFFPAVTGFTQGVSMSGDLANPGESIPLGTFIAVFLSSFIYIGAAVVFAAGLPQKVMASDYESMAKLSKWAWLIDAGVISATLSSAMASFMGAPRILQALAVDKIFPALSIFAAGVGPTNNPRNGVLLTLVIALATIGLGNLNIIAPVVSMCFLVSYGLLNYATWFETRTSSPSFRPRFRWFNKYTSLAGALACLSAMLFINPGAGIAASAVIMAVYQYLRRVAPVSRWADGKRSYSFSVVREHLLAMGTESTHPRDWRPQILAFSESGPGRESLLRFAGWLEGEAGITSAVAVIEDKSATREAVEKVKAELSTEIKEGGFNAFPVAISAEDLHQALTMLVQAYGVGPLSANIVLLNWTFTGESEDDAPQPVKLKYGRYLKEAIKLGRNVICLKADENDRDAIAKSEPEQRLIDVLWFDDPSSRLSLLLAYLMTRTPYWSDAKIRVLAPRPKVTEGYEEKLAATIEEMRIDCTSKVIAYPSHEEAKELCKDTSIAFLPFNLEKARPASRITDDLNVLLKELPATALVLAAQDIDLAAEPDEGKPAELAAAMDAIAEATEKLSEAEKELSAAEKAKEKLPEDAESKEVNQHIDAINKARGKVNRAKEKLQKLNEEAPKL